MSRKASVMVLVTAALGSACTPCHITFSEGALRGVSCSGVEPDSSASQMTRVNLDNPGGLPWLSLFVSFDGPVLLPGMHGRCSASLARDDAVDFADDEAFDVVSYGLAPLAGQCDYVVRDVRPRGESGPVEFHIEVLRMTSIEREPQHFAWALGFDLVTTREPMTSAF